MVNLIASDLDGTLLLNGAKNVSEEAIEFIQKLHRYDVVFVAASGRQYPNLRRLFQQVEDEIAYICENGALVKYKNQTILKKSMDREMGLKLMEDIYQKEGCEVLLSGENTSYLKPKDKSYVSHMKNYVGNNVKLVESFDEVEEEFLKISVYKEDGIGGCSDYFHERWAGNFTDTVSGKCWMDFVAPGVDKGVALKEIQRMLHIAKEDTMCFGDSYNDLELFKNALYSYAMTGANSEIRAKARYVTNNVESVLYDVYKVLSR